MPFKNPREETPNDGERYQFKVIGDPEVVDIKHPAIGKFSVIPNVGKGYIGTFIDEESGNTVDVWDDDTYNEVALYRPVSELLAELH